MFDDSSYDFPLVERLIRGLEFQIAPIVSKDGTYYDWVPYPVGLFMQGLWSLQQVKPGGTFLEVGCGIGTKAILASLAGFQVTGIELRQEYVAVSRKLIGDFGLEIEIIKEDAMEFPNYDSFDCIYAYSPFINVADEDKLESKIMDNCNPDAKLYFPVSEFPATRNWTKSIHGIWRD